MLHWSKGGPTLFGIMGGQIKVLLKLLELIPLIIKLLNNDMMFEGFQGSLTSSYMQSQQSLHWSREEPTLFGIIGV